MGKKLERTVHDEDSLDRLGKFNVALLLVVSITSVGVLLRWYPPFEPAEVWGDHVFYWAQANSWLGVADPLNLSNTTETFLQRYYTTYYYSPLNGLDGQPPYVYRPLVPVAAGILGHLLGLEQSFLAISTLSLVLLSLLCGLSVQRLTKSRLASMTAALAAIWLPGLGIIASQYALVEVETLTLVSLTIYLVISRRIKTAILIAAVVGPLLRETLSLWATTIVLVAVLTYGRQWLRWLPLAVLIPLSEFALLRILISVPEPPLLSELFVLENPLSAVYSFTNAYGLVGVVLLGLLTPRAYGYVVALLPIAASIFVVNSSVVSAGDRLWLTLWPALLIFGIASMWDTLQEPRVRASWVVLTAVTFMLPQSAWLGLTTRQVLWLIPLLLLAWVFLALGLPRLRVKPARDQLKSEVQTN